MKWSTSVITTLSSDTEPAVMLTFNDGKYIFNTSENTMRRFLQSGQLWRRTKALFFTQARVEKMSGLPGLIMTFADATINKLQLIGPSGLNHLLASMRVYTYRDSIAVQSSEIPWTTSNQSEPSPCFADDNVTVYAIPAIPQPIPKSSDMSSDVASAMDSEIETTGKRKRDPSADAPRKRLNMENEVSPTVSEAMKVEENITQDLDGEDKADAFRRKIIQAMFPGTNIPTPQEVAASSQVPPQVNEVANFSNADIDEQRRKKAALPTGFWKQLPKFSRNLPQMRSPPTLSYLVIGPRTRGKFDVEKAVALGVPRGPLRGKLTKGESIMVEVEVDGKMIQRTVNPDDVLGKAEPRSVILVLDVPTPDHIPSLVSAFKASTFYRQFWAEDPSSLSLEDPELSLRIVYQTCGKGVLEDERYKAFLRGFGSVAYHMVASREHCPDPITFTSMSQNQLRLNQLDEKMFPIPKYTLVPKKDISTIPGLPSNIQFMSHNDQNVMRPFTPPSVDPTAIALDKFHPLVNGKQPLELSSNLQRYIKAAQESIAEVEASGELPPIEGSDVGIVTLGTGGSLPTKYRNVLSTLVKIPGWGNILLDAGEGTWGQLVRTFGLQDEGYNVWQALRDIKCIFISHVHADHHIGLAHILAKRSQLDPPPTQPLYVVSIRNVHLYLREIQDVQDIGIDDPSGNGVVHVLSESLHFRQLGAYVENGMWQIGGDEDWLEYNKSVESARKMCEALGLEYFKTADVEHRCRAFGASFKHKDGWSITFSGDTSPSASLRELGMNSTVLIHEATMDDEEIVMARRKAHSTMSQAIAEGERMNAKNVLLTHFSARYPKIPPYILKDPSLQRVTPATYQKDRAIVPAFDYLNLTIGDMWKMQFYLRPLIQAIREGGDIDDDEARSGRSPSPVRNPPPRKNKQSAGFVERSSHSKVKIPKKDTIHEGKDSDRGRSVGRGHPVRMLPASPNNGSQGSTQDVKAASKADA